MKPTQSSTSTKSAIAAKNNQNANQAIKKTKYSFDEFKLYYESTEKVSDRRIANNNLNYSICVAVMLAIGFLWNWSINNPKYSYPSLTLVCLLATVAALYTQLWRAQIRDYKRLNAAKFEVLNEMAPHVIFNDQPSIPDINVISCNPFQKEWEKVKNLGGLQKKTRFNITALSSSNQEYFIPQAFFGIFLLLVLVALLSIVLHFNLFIGQWQNFLQI